MLNTLLLIFELVGTISFSLSGALTAMRKNMDIFGACVLGMTTAVGGGVIRDIILGMTPPTVFVNPTRAIIGFLIPTLAYIPIIQKFLTRNKHKTFDFCLMLADAIGLSSFTVIGVNTCFNAIQNPNVFTVAFLGVITGVGGGILRDVMSLNLPKVFVKHFHASASLIGAVTVFVIRMYFSAVAASIAGAVVILTLRLLAYSLRWTLPKPRYGFEQENK